ncbi:S41 family peptidase [Paenibacillus phoenicis]|uniref:S41 family peptidase n=1 Tax=Paenibacillus phoenicis TaxID=554117 RepID=A0ABU5PN02_9BACL|nr:MULTISPECIES: S41 family peptidase [Paenibacillus]EES72724.1 peptidase, S41 family [Paenibacillus sp. oral taxon 786 str. D14]MCT2195959.1 S41 family peptidase [Paenibacillus sp. p3-SID1389]MEA3571310.1 S41 family peptidase [Paenibacillus phoenicis]
MFKGRTVALLVVAAMLVSSLLTLTLTGEWSFAGTGPLRSGSFADTASTGSKQDIKKIETALQLVQKNYVEDVDTNKLIDGAIDGMMNALEDPFSSYMAPDTAQQFSEQIEGSFTGIGAEVSMENGNVVVVSPIKGSPAEKAGIQPKDILLSVNGESFEGLSLNEAVAKIRGPKGTTAKVKVKRAGVADTLEFEIVRDDIALETVYAEMKDGKIGVITVTEFSLNTADHFKKELENLEKQGMKGLIIDVRNNPGGVLDVVEAMSEQFVPKGKAIVQIEDKYKRRQQSVSKGSGKSYPIAVLTNKGSASASEILAGALQESAGAKLVGETTYGKGTVQSSYSQEMGDGSMLKITIAKWLTPNGEWIHKKGIKPDVEVSQPDYFTVAPINKEKTYKYDMLGEDIKSAQTMLDGLGYNPGRKDGYFDKNTEKALKKFQTDQKLTANGVLDAKTAEALEASIIQQIRDPKNDMQLNRALEIMRKEIAK